MKEATKTVGAFSSRLYQATRREIIVRAVQESARIAAARPEKGRGR